MDHPTKYNDDFSKKLQEWNRTTMKYNVPIDGFLAWTTMFGMYMLDFKPLPILVTGGLIHGVVHPRIS